MFVNIAIVSSSSWLTHIPRFPVFLFIMPPLKIPETLFSASMKKFSCQFLMDNYAGNRTDCFLHGLNSLPVRIFNEVVENIIKKMSVCDPPYTKGTSLTSVLTSVMSEKLTHLDLSYLDSNGHANLFPHFNEAFLRVLPLLTNLVHLNLFHASYMPTCNDGILRSICKYCNLLKYLNISYNCVTDQALLCLIPSDDCKGCPELENIEILHCSVVAITVAQLLEKLPNIRNIRYEYIEEALLLLHRSLKCNNYNFVLRLKSLSLHFLTKSLWEKCKICGTKEMPLALCLSNLCPEIERVSVRCNNKDVPVLKFFTKLTSFEIYFRDDDSAGVETIYYLTNYGAQLTTLKIDFVTFDSNLFLTIGKACPSLRELSVDCDYLVNTLKFEPGEEKTLKVFTFLSSFSLQVLYSRENSMEPLTVLQLLKSTCSLTLLSFRCSSLMCDDEGFKEYWNMINTQSLSVTISGHHYRELDLTMSTVRLILDSCPVLKKLSGLYTWKIDEEEVELLKTSLKESNYDVEIIYWHDFNEH